jgi:MOSC domain-containing protein YiiM
VQTNFMIHHLYVSPGHNYFGRPKDGPGDHPTLDVDEAELRAGKGIVGDRYFGAPAHYDAQITFVAQEVFDLVVAEFGIKALSPIVMRRNVVTGGLNLNQLLGEEFTIDCGRGPVRFLGTRPCSPCAWMDAVIAPGANRFLKGRGGLRARVLTDGVLAKGAATIETGVDLDRGTIADPLPRPALPD